MKLKHLKIILSILGVAVLVLSHLQAFYFGRIVENIHIMNILYKN